MNPYHPNADSTAPAAEKCAIAKGTLRWRVIPAALSWLVGGLSLLAVPFGLYNNRNSFDIDWAMPPLWILLYVAQLSLIPLMFLFGVANISAGRWWMKGRWYLAMTFNIVPGLVMMLMAMAIEQLQEWLFV